MKYNNGDMDDLFRRASDRYPLRTDSADWNRLANALDEPAPLPDGEDTRRKRRGVFWWFLLLPLAGIGYMTWQVRAHQSASNVKTATVQKAPQGSGDGARTRTVGTGQQANVAGTGDAAKSGKAVSDANVVGGSNAGVVGGSNAGVVGGSNAGVGGNAGQTKSAGTGGAEVSKMRNRDINSTAGADSRSLRQVHAQVGKGIKRQQTGGESTIENIRGSRDANETGARVQKVRKLRHSDDKESDAPTGQSGAIGLVTGTKGSVTDHSGNSDHSLVLAALDMRRAPIAGGYNVVVDVQAPVWAAESTPAKKATKRTSHVYIGLSGAPDLSTVKFQSMKGVGTTFGLLLGYSFNDRWAVETGLYLDRKRYYTQGEYFNTKNVRLPYNDKLLTVDGTCYMWEIPLNVRYNFSTSPKMKWFATAGLSTYLMSREKYAYQYDYAGAGQTWDSSWNIHRPSQYWFSIVNLSAGFEQRIGKIGNLRVEPYIRVPLSGIGTGKLPIMSAGVNIGITRQLW